MKVDQFLIDFFRESDTVEVKAVDLQDTLRLQSMMEAQIEELKAERAKLKREVQKLQTRVQLMEASAPLKLDLRG